MARYKHSDSIKRAFKEYRCWDYCYIINVLVEMLKDHARCCRDGHCVRSEQLYRRGMTAAGLLEDAYNKHEAFSSREFKKFSEQHPIEWLPSGKNRVKMQRKCEAGKEDFVEKREVRIRKRAERLEKQMKKEAWAYIHKYIEHLWD